MALTFFNLTHRGGDRDKMTNRYDMCYGFFHSHPACTGSQTKDIIMKHMNVVGERIPIPPRTTRGLQLFRLVMNQVKQRIFQFYPTQCRDDLSNRQRNPGPG